VKMSIQDDYFDLRAELKDWQLKALNRLWDRLCETEMDDDETKQKGIGITQDK